MSVETKFDSIKDWQMHPSGETYLSVKKAIYSFVTSMQSELKNEKNNYLAKLSAESEAFNATTIALREQYITKPNEQAEVEFQNYIKQINNSWTGEKGALTIVSNALNSCSFEFAEIGVVDRIAISIAKSRNASTIEGFTKTADELKSDEISITQLLQNAVSAAKKVQISKNAYNEKVYDRMLSKAKEEHNQRVNLIENEHKNEAERILQKYESLFKPVFNAENFIRAEAVAKSSMKPAIGYTCKEGVPDTLYLGTRCFSVYAEKDELYFPEVLNLFKSVGVPNIYTENNLIKITLPYCRTREEGFSIFFECIDSSSERIQDIVKNYTLKILMNFPAGQTRPVLFDNDSLATFQQFVQIGESSGRGIITRPWAKEEDITNQLIKVADERSKLSIFYGNDINSRLEREIIYYICGRNFPKGFNNKAIEQLSNIFLGGSKNGFFGLIQATSSELKARKDDHEFSFIIDTIKKNSLYINECREGKYLVIDESTADIFEFDPFTEEMNNSREIISVIINGVANYKRQIEKFEYLFSKDAGNVEGTDANNINTWYRGQARQGISIPVGISGASTVQKYVIGETKQHALISGVTGSGKSALIRTMIVSTMMKYTPDNVNLYLVDFKEGVELQRFSKYRLPWIKAIALNTKREFALNILRDLMNEFKRRSDIMKKYGVNTIGEVTQESVPRLILLFDEVQELLRENDEITSECINILSSLVSEGRAMNINVILSSQDFTNCSGIERLKANMVIRIALKGSPASAKSIMGDDFSSEQLEDGDSGYAAINSASGERGKTTFFQAGYLSTEECDEILAKFQMTMQNKPCNTRVMSSNASQDRNNKFNRLICNDEIEFSNDPLSYDLMIGEAFNIGGNKSISISPEKGENLLSIGEAETVAKSIFSLTMLSVLYDELAAKAKKIDNELVRIIDLSSDDENYNSDYFEFMESVFNKQITRATLKDCKEMISDTYDNLVKRMNGEYDKDERLFFMLFGIDGAQDLRQEMVSDDGELTINGKLERIITNGPAYGINTLVWSRTLSAFKQIVDSKIINTDFKKRMYFGDNDEECNMLTGKNANKASSSGNVVMFRDLNRVSPSLFRNYDIPDKDWVISISNTYKRFEDIRNEGNKDE